MTTRDNYMKVASNIAQHMNIYRQAFKTYHLDDFDKMIKEVAGDSAHISGESTFESFKSTLLERGFMIFPNPITAEDGYCRVIRTGSVIANLLNSFVYVGPTGDDDLAKMLTQLKRRPSHDDFNNTDGE